MICEDLQKYTPHSIVPTGARKDRDAVCGGFLPEQPQHCTGCIEGVTGLSHQYETIEHPFAKYRRIRK